MTERLPALLTVEEAAALLRIGRTKAYAMAKQWRASGGRTGLPVVDLGDVLRVPLARLEEIVGAELRGGVLHPDQSRAGAEPERVEVTDSPAPVVVFAHGQPAQGVKVAITPRHRRAKNAVSQLDMFNTADPT